MKKKDEPEKDTKQKDYVDTPIVRKGETSVRKLFSLSLPGKLDPFDVSKIVTNPTTGTGFEPDKLMVFLGKRRTGKTFSIDSMLGSYCGSIGYDLYEIFPGAIVITGTKLNRFWEQRFPREYIHTSLDVLPIFYEYQEHLVSKWWEKDEYRDPESPGWFNPYRLLVIDDMVGEKHFKEDTGVIQTAIKGRHYKCCVMLTTQYIKLINTTVRENLDLLFVMFQSTLLSKETIAESFMSGVDKWEAMAYIDEHTQVKGEQREVLVWDNSKLVRNLEEKMFQLIPEKPEDYLVGNEAYWKSELDRYHNWVKKKEGRRARSRAKWEKSKHAKIKPVKIDDEGLNNAGQVDSYGSDLIPETE